MLTKELLLNTLEYRREEGSFYYIRSGHGKISGQKAGCVRGTGYTVIIIKGKQYKAHRLVWLAEYGEFPSGQIDHKDKNKGNNHISNLRIVTDQENKQNKDCAKGYSINNRGSYSVTLSFLGKQKFIGRYKTEEEAKAAYIEAKKKHYAGYIHTED